MIKKAKMKEEDMVFHRREIDTLNMCNHPNIIKILDAFENLEYFIIVLEYLKGGDLFDYLEARND